MNNEKGKGKTRKGSVTKDSLRTLGKSVPQTRVVRSQVNGRGDRALGVA